MHVLAESVAAPCANEPPTQFCVPVWQEAQSRPSPCVLPSALPP